MAKVIVKNKMSRFLCFTVYITLKLEKCPRKCRLGRADIRAYLSSLDRNFLACRKRGWGDDPWSWRDSWWRAHYHWRRRLNSRRRDECRKYTSRFEFHNSTALWSIHWPISPCENDWWGRPLLHENLADTDPPLAKVKFWTLRFRATDGVWESYCKTKKWSQINFLSHNVDGILSHLWWLAHLRRMFLERFLKKKPVVFLNVGFNVKGITYSLIFYQLVWKFLISDVSLRKCLC